MPIHIVELRTSFGTNEGTCWRKFAGNFDAKDTTEVRRTFHDFITNIALLNGNRDELHLTRNLESPLILLEFGEADEEFEKFIIADNLKAVIDDNWNICFPWLNISWLIISKLLLVRDIIEQE